MTPTTTLPATTPTELVICLGCLTATPEDEATRTDCLLDADFCTECATEHERRCWSCATEAAATAD